MLKSQRAAYLWLMVALDVAALFAAFCLAWAMRDSLGAIIQWSANLVGHPIEGMVRQRGVHFVKPNPPTIRDLLFSPNPLVGFRGNLAIFYVTAAAWLFFLNAQRAYDVAVRRSTRQEFALCAYAGLLGIATFLVLVFLGKYQVSRLLVLGFLLTGVAFLWFERSVLLPALQGRARKPFRNMIVIGSAAAVGHFRTFLDSPAYRGSRFLGYVSDEPHTENEQNETAKNEQSPALHLGKLGELATILDRQIVDEVVIVRSATDSANAQALASQTWGDVLELCLQRGRTVSMVDDILPPVGAKVEATTMGGLPTLVMHNTPQNPLGLAAKGLMDRVIAMIAILVLSPLLLGIAAAIKITSPGGPVLFRQKRVGLNGRQFSFYKFRSMVPNAEKFKDEHPELFAGINTMSGPFFKSEDDPRITRIGKILRKYSLDELPQFWNVLRGDMSLVGPRPPLPREVEALEPWQRRKLSVKGGLTCLWQVSGRNDIDTDEWMRLDLEYIDNWSLWLDVKLVFQTVKVLVKPKGAS